VLVDITPNVGVPAAISIGSGTEPSCVITGSPTTTYTSSASNSTSLNWSVSDGAAGSINSSGVMSWTNGFYGSVDIQVTANGCNGPSAQTIRTVTIGGTVGTPVFVLGSNSTRCQGVGSITYTANAANGTIVYTLDGTSLGAGNTINASTGEVTYVAAWTGSTTIIATASGCGGPKSANHKVTVVPNVGTPVFTMGASSTRCIGAGTVTYTANVTDGTIVYSLDAPSIAGGNSINAGNGQVTYAAGWSGTTTITATATGCNGPTSANHVVTINTCPTTLNLKVYLEGFYLGSGLMNRATNISFTPQWGATKADTFRVELRDASDFNNIIYIAYSNYLNTDGTATISIPNIYTGDYYICVLQRNHLEIVSATAISFLSSPVNYDFTNAAAKSYGDNTKDVGSGIFAMYCGDITQSGMMYEYPNTPIQDGMIDLDDNYYVFTSYLNGDLGYKISDLNGDGMVDINDVYFAFDNYLLGIYVQTP
jgi:hypothetical protein